jgi:hypothetical protein
VQWDWLGEGVDCCLAWLDAQDVTNPRQHARNTSKTATWAKK